MKKRKVRKSNSRNNRLMYTLVAFGILVVVAIGVYALGAVPNPGHAISELQTCDEGQTLVVQNGEWTCATPVSGGDEGIKGWEIIEIDGGTSNSIFDTLSPYMPNVGDRLLATGIAVVSPTPQITVYLERSSSSRIIAYYSEGDGRLHVRNFDDGSRVSQSGTKLGVLVFEQ
jgi:hypothetical protein